MTKKTTILTMRPVDKITNVGELNARVDLEAKVQKLLEEE